MAEELAKGLFYKEIADRLHISRATVTQHVHHIYERLRVTNKTEALNKLRGLDLTGAATSAQRFGADKDGSE